MPVIAVGRLGDPATATRRGRERQGRFHRARPHADRRSAMGRRSLRAASRSGAASPATPASTRCAAARGIGCVVNGAAGRETLFADRAAAAGRAHRGDRRRARPASPMRRWSPTATPSRCSRRTSAPAARSATPARRRCSRRSRRTEQSFERYIADMVAACERKGVTFRFGTDVAARPGRCWRRSTAS